MVWGSDIVAVSNTGGALPVLWLQGVGVMDQRHCAERCDIPALSRDPVPHVASETCHDAIPDNRDAVSGMTPVAMVHSWGGPLGPSGSDRDPAPTGA